MNVLLPTIGSVRLPTIQAYPRQGTDGYAVFLTLRFGERFFLLKHIKDWTCLENDHQSYSL